MNFLKYFQHFVVVLIFLSAIIQNYATHSFSGIVNFQIDEVSNSSIDCSTCEFVATYVEGYLVQNKTEGEIESLLDQLCAIAPLSFSTECQDFINEEVPVIISEFETYETPVEVCNEMGFC